MESSPEVSYGKFELVLTEASEITADEMQQMLEALDTDIDGFEDILTGVLKNEPAENLTVTASARGKSAINATISTLNDTQNIENDPNVSNHSTETADDNKENQNLPKQPVKSDRDAEQPDKPVIGANAAPSGRFKKLKTEELEAIEQNQYSEATKRNTQWGVRVFNGTKDHSASCKVINKRFIPEIALYSPFDIFHE